MLSKKNAIMWASRSLILTILDIYLPSPEKSVYRAIFVL